MIVDVDSRAPKPFLLRRNVYSERAVAAAAKTNAKRVENRLHLIYSMSHVLQIIRPAVVAVLQLQRASR